MFERDFRGSLAVKSERQMASRTSPRFLSLFASLDDNNAC